MRSQKSHYRGLTAKPAYHLERRETVTELGCKVTTGWTALAYDRKTRAFTGVIEHVTLEGPADAVEQNG
jgi:hypothetical protein